MTIYKPFKFIELFAGIGGFRQALDPLGGECVLSSEIDKFANDSYEIIYGHRTAGDIFKIGSKEVSDHDILVGGFPCQAFSLAGKRGGFDDARGTLFFEALRIAKEKRPKVLFLENVKGLVSHDKGKTLDTMITALSEIGYAVDFNILNSKYFGVPQNRERIFIIAFREDLVTLERWKIEGNGIIAKGKKRISEYEWLKTFNFSWPKNKEIKLKLKDILEKEVDEKYYLSEEKTKGLLMKIEETDGLPIKEATKKGFTLAKEGDSVNYQFPESKTRRGRIGKGIANTLEASNINQGVVEEEKTNKLEKYRIRKLTPLECWRLQGFNDEVHEKVKAGGISDSQRYKQAGNAVTVNVIRAIAEKILETLENGSETDITKHLSDSEREGIINTLSVFGTKSEEFYRMSDDVYLEKEHEKLAMGKCHL